MGPRCADNPAGTAPRRAPPQGDTWTRPQNASTLNQWEHVHPADTDLEGVLSMLRQAAPTLDRFGYELLRRAWTTDNHQRSLLGLLFEHALAQHFRAQRLFVVHNTILPTVDPRPGWDTKTQYDLLALDFATRTMHVMEAKTRLPHPHALNRLWVPRDGSPTAWIDGKPWPDLLHQIHKQLHVLRRADPRLISQRIHTAVKPIWTLQPSIHYLGFASLGNPPIGVDDLLLEDIPLYAYSPDPFPLDYDDLCATIARHAPPIDTLSARD